MSNVEIEVEGSSSPQGRRIVHSIEINKDPVKLFNIKNIYSDSSIRHYFSEDDMIHPTKQGPPMSLHDIMSTDEYRTIVSTVNGFIYEKRKKLLGVMRSQLIFSILLLLFMIAFLVGSLVVMEFSTSIYFLIFYYIVLLVFICLSLGSVILIITASLRAKKDYMLTVTEITEFFDRLNNEKFEQRGIHLSVERATIYFGGGSLFMSTYEYRIVIHQFETVM